MEILSRFNVPFSAMPSPLVETFTDDPPREQVVRLSKAKIDALVKERPGVAHSLILGADTCISYHSTILGKPADADHAKEMLRRFSGDTHQVITGLTLYNGQTGEYLQKSETADVTFAVLHDEELAWYLSTGEWKGAAGGYRIQGKGALFIESMHGSYYNVMGLPIRLFYGMLAQQNPQLSLWSL